MTVTLRHVADRAGVSIKTVSRVINGQGEISEATRARVRRIIQELDYRPNSLARGLVSGRSDAIALIIPQITDPFFPDVLLGAEAVAREHGYSVFLCNTNDNPEQELAYVDMMAGKRVDGVIICGTRLNAAQLEQVARHHRVSIISSRNPASAAGISLPAAAGVCEAASHLIRLGHRRIGHLGLGPDENVREQGYRRAMAEHDLPVESAWVKHVSSLSVETAFQAALELLEIAPELTALSCSNDLAAVGTLRACAALGRRVPDDLAVVGFDDIELASLVTPALTTVHVPRYEVGKMAMEQLLRVIAADGKLSEHIEVKVHMVVRDSCGARRGAAASDRDLHEPTGEPA
jgi:LacI family repressor for deo operon, udp, cdd, tsx, nupC, and nupG